MSRTVITRVLQTAATGAVIAVLPMFTVGCTTSSGIAGPGNGGTGTAFVRPTTVAADTPAGVEPVTGWMDAFALLRASAKAQLSDSEYLSIPEGSTT